MVDPRLINYFELYAKNWTLVRQALGSQLRITPDVENVFVCLICFKFFSESDPDEISLEHVPPDSVGGKVRTITCKVCNSESGSKLDNHLALKLEHEDIFAERSSGPLQAHASIDGIRLPIDFYKEDNNFSIVIPNNDKWQQKCRSQIDAFTEKVVSGKFEINVEYKLHSSKRANAAILRSAYLWAFSVFGYGVLINPHFPVIRGQIHNPEENILSSQGYGFLSGGIPDELLGVNLIKSPREARSLLVVLDVTSELGTKTRYGVMLPGPSLPGPMIYDWLESHQEEPINYQLEHIPEFDFLDAPMAFQMLWNELTATN
ncbi:MAG: hypothetical protein JXA10_13800 [Anaerolineae bacterium]|nr:hypothetical protein [Anaerolineae bacterium]